MLGKHTDCLYFKCNKTNNMKKLIAIIAIALIQTWVSAQTNLEKLVLKELNAYRATKGELPVVYSTTVTKASAHHTKWLALTDVLSHYETIDVPGFNEIENVEERGEFFKIWDATDNKGSSGSDHTIMEICNQTIAREANPFVIKMKSDAQLAKDIIEKFSLSVKGHNEAMLFTANPGETIMTGIGVIVKGEKAYVTINYIFTDQ